MSLDKIALLPEGFHDLLPSDAARNEFIRSKLSDGFASYGYELVSPPLLEFEDSLFHGTGNALAPQTFRVMDPQSQKMMGLRADITTQITRIATTRLTSTPLPLRLAYAGTVLRVHADDLYGKRQRTQAGIELIGAPAIQSEVEILNVTINSLHALGVNNISVDFNLPKVKQLLLQEMGLSSDQIETLDTALNKKEVEIITQLAGSHSDVMAALITPSSDIKKTIKLLESLPLPKEALLYLTELQEIIIQLKQAQPSITITLDPLESYGMVYHSGISFSLFSKRQDSQMGRGGRYVISSLERDIEAVGFTLYLDSIIPLLPETKQNVRIYIPLGTDLAVIEGLQEKSMVTILGLEAVEDIVSEAKRLECNAVWKDGNFQNIHR